MTWAWTLGLIAAILGGPSEPEGSILLRGKVMELSKALDEKKIVADRQPIENQVVLRTEDGTIVPLLSDEASRALFLTPELRDRPAELRVRRQEGLPYVQVLTVRVEENGRFLIPEFYCEICNISVRAPQICPCCQGEMTLRYKPEPR